MAIAREPRRSCTIRTRLAGVDRRFDRGPLYPRNPPFLSATIHAQVDSKMGAVAWALWPAPRFPSPLIEPDVPISGLNFKRYRNHEIEVSLEPTCEEKFGNTQCRSICSDRCDDFLTVSIPYKPGWLGVWWRRVEIEDLLNRIDRGQR